MADKKISLKVEADTRKAKEDLKKLGKSIHSLDSVSRRTNRSLGDENRELKKLSLSANKASTSIKKTATSTEVLAGVGKSARSASSSIGALAVGFIGLASAISAVKTIADFEQGITKLGAISQATTAELEAMTKVSRTLGATTEFSATQVAEGMNFLAMAGFNASQNISAINGVLDLATVGMIDLGSASDIASNILSGFGLKASDIGMVTDVMSATITHANTDIQQMGEAMKYVAPKAKSMGISIADASTAIGILANAGLQGGIGGTALAQVLTKITGVTPQARAELEKLNVSAYDADGNFVGLKKSLENLSKGLEGLTTQEKTDVINKVFGVEASKGVLILLGEINNSWDTLNGSIENSNGLTKKMATTIRGSLSNEFKSFESAIQEIILKIGDELLPTIKETVTELTLFARNMDSDTIKDFATSIKSAISAVRGLGSAVAGINDIAMPDWLAGKDNAGLIDTSVKGWGEVGNSLDEFINGVGDANKKVTKSNKEMANSYDGLAKSAQKAFDEAGIKDVKITPDNAIDSLLKYKDALHLTEKQLDEYKQSLLSVSKGATDSIQSISKMSKYNSISPSHYNSKTQSIEDNSGIKKYNKQVTDLLAISKKAGDSLSAISSIAPFTETIDSAKSAKKAVNSLNSAQGKTLSTIQGDLTKRTEFHAKSIKTMIKSENKLVNEVEKLQKEIVDIEAKYDNKRINAKASADDKLYSAGQKGKTDYEKYQDDELRYTEKINLAKQALSEGNLTLYGKYYSDAESLASSWAGNEIKENDKVVVTRETTYSAYKQQNAEMLQLQLQSLTMQEQKEIEAHNQKIDMKRIELATIKTQLEANQAMYNAEMEMLAKINGKKVEKKDFIDFTKNYDELAKLDDALKNSKRSVDINTNPAIQSLQNLINKNADTQAKISAPSSVQVDTANAVSKVTSLNSIVINDKRVRVTADTTPASFGIKKLITTEDGNDINISVNPEWTEAEAQINEFKNGASEGDIHSKLVVSTDEATNTISILEKDTKSVHHIKADDKDVKSDIAKIEMNTSSIHTITPNTTSVDNAIKKLSANTHSTHYIQERIIPANKSVTEQAGRYASGGWTKYQNKINGHDLHGKDDIKALLTRGEFIQNVRAVDYYGSDFMNKLNNRAIPKEALPKYASGGLVLNNQNSSSLSTLTNRGSSSSSSGTSGFNGSNWEDLIKSLNDMLATDLPPAFRDMIEKMLSSVKVASRKFRDKEDTQEGNITNLMGEVQGKDLSPNEYKSYQAKKLNADMELSKISRDTEDAIEKYNTDFASIKLQLADYLEEVSYYSDILDKKFEEIYVKEPFNVGKSSDLDRIKKYIKSLDRRDFMTLGEANHYLKYDGFDYGLTNGYIERNGIGRYTMYNEKYANHINKGLLPRFKSGGMIDGENGGALRGYGGGDRRLILAEDGEGIIRKEAMSRLGVDWLNQINSLQLPRFKTGGIVGDSSISSKDNAISKSSVDVNFTDNFGSRLTTTTDEQTAKQLEKYFKRFA